MDDVALVMAGLLPVEKGDETTGDVSFGKRPLVVDNAKTDNVQGLVSAISNRYTVARGVAERAVDLVYHKLGREVRPCRTELTRIHGADFFRFDELVREVGRRAARGRRSRHRRPAGPRPRLRLRRGAASGARASRVGSSPSAAPTSSGRRWCTPPGARWSASCPTRSSAAPASPPSAIPDAPSSRSAPIWSADSWDGTPPGARPSCAEVRDRIPFRRG